MFEQRVIIRENLVPYKKENKGIISRRFILNFLSNGSATIRDLVKKSHIKRDAIRYHLNVLIKLEQVVMVSPTKRLGVVSVPTVYTLSKNYKKHTKKIRKEI